MHEHRVHRSFLHFHVVHCDDHHCGDHHCGDHHCDDHHFRMVHVSPSIRDDQAHLFFFEKKLMKKKVKIVLKLVIN